MNIPPDPSVSYISIVIFLIGLFLFLSGLNIIKIEKIFVSHGFKTWFFGLFLIIASIAIITPKILPSGNISLLFYSDEIPNIPNSGFERGEKYWGFKFNPSEDYRRGIDNVISHTGKNSAYIEAVVDKPSKSTKIYQIHPNIERLKGKRVRITSFIKTKDADEAGMWARVDLDNNGHILDNMMDRPIFGTTNWKQYEIILDVPTNSTGLIFGAIFNGKGKAWYDDFKFELVNKNIPTTEVEVENYSKEDN